MIKKEIKNYCKYCGKEVPQKHINGLNNNESFTCESCGVENEIVSIEIPDFVSSDLEKKEKEKNMEKSGDIESKSGYSQIRLFFFRYIYEILKSPEHFSKISEKCQELSLQQLKTLSRTLRNMIIDQQIPDYWLSDLSSIERVVLAQSYKSTRSFLIDKDIYKKEFFILFCQGIEFITKVINKGHDFTKLQGLKRQIVEDLKYNYGFASAINSHKDFEFKLTILRSRYIYKEIKSFELTNNLERTEFHNKIKEEWKNDVKNSHKKRFVKKYIKFQEDLNSDQIYSQSFTHHLGYLKEIVSGLINKRQVLHELNGLERVIAEDLKKEVFPNLDTTLQQKFKFNLLIVLSRFVFYFIKLYNNKIPLKKKIEGSIVNLIATNLESEIVANNKLKGAWIEKLNNISPEEFNQQYRELRRLLNTDWIYKESFIESVRWLTDIVFNLISEKRKESKLQDFEKLLLKDLNSFFFEDKLEIRQNEHPTLVYIQNLKDIFGVNNYESEKALSLLLLNSLKSITNKRSKTKKPDKYNPWFEERTLLNIEYNMEQMFHLNIINSDELSRFYGFHLEYCRLNDGFSDRKSSIKKLILELRKALSPNGPCASLVSKEYLFRSFSVGDHFADALDSNKRRSGKSPRWLVSKLIFKITRYSGYIDRAKALKAIQEFACSINHPIIDISRKEFIFIDALRYAIADDTGEFLSDEGLSLFLSQHSQTRINKDWARRAIDKKKEISPKTLNKLVLFINRYAWTKIKSKKLSEFAFLNYSRRKTIDRISSGKYNENEAKINIEHFDKLQDLSIKKYLNFVSRKKGFPVASILGFNKYPRISSFNNKMTGFKHEIHKKAKRDFVKLLIKKDLVKIYTDSDKAPKYISDLLETSRDKYTKRERDGSSGLPGHTAIEKRLLANSEFVVGTEIPIYYSIRDTCLIGHIDVLSAKNNGKLMACDYKPDKTHKIGSKIFDNFINSVPQAVTYALSLIRTFNIKAGCVLFNNGACWEIDDPKLVLDEITEFMHKRYSNLPSYTCRWEKIL